MANIMKRVKKALKLFVLIFLFIKSNFFIPENSILIRCNPITPKKNSTGADHVLENFTSEEKESLDEITKNISESLSTLIKKDLDLFSSKVNQK